MNLFYLCCRQTEVKVKIPSRRILKFQEENHAELFESTYILT